MQKKKVRMRQLILTFFLCIEIGYLANEKKEGKKNVKNCNK